LSANRHVQCFSRVASMTCVALHRQKTVRLESRQSCAETADAWSHLKPTLPAITAWCCHKHSQSFWILPLRVLPKDSHPLHAVAADPELSALVRIAVPAAVCCFLLPVPAAGAPAICSRHDYTMLHIRRT
jgi:hypothetical protein